MVKLLGFDHPVFLSYIMLFRATIKQCLCDLYVSRFKIKEVRLLQKKRNKTKFKKIIQRKMPQFSL